VSGDPLDPAKLDLARRRWVAEDRIVKSAWSVTRAQGLDPEYAERIERAAADDDLEAFELAVAEFLDALE
jgi:hypothetical protein